MNNNKEIRVVKDSGRDLNSFLSEVEDIWGEGNGQKELFPGADLRSVEAMRAEAIEQSGLLHLTSVPETLSKMSRDQAMFHLNLVMELMEDQIAVWSPYRPGSPKPQLRFHMKTGKNPESGTVTLEGDHGAWGFFAIFENDPLFGALYQYGVARVDSAYKVHADGIEARFPGPETVALRLVKNDAEPSAT